MGFVLSQFKLANIFLSAFFKDSRKTILDYLAEDFVQSWINIFSAIFTKVILEIISEVWIFVFKVKFTHI